MEMPRYNVDTTTGYIRMHPDDWLKLQRYQKALEQTVARLVGSDPNDEGWEEALANAISTQAGWNEYDPIPGKDPSLDAEGTEDGE